MPWTTPETFTAGQTLTAASMNAITENTNVLPRLIAYTLYTTQTPASPAATITSMVDVAGFSVTWTATSSRLYRITFSAPVRQYGAGGQLGVIIADASNNVQSETYYTLSGTDAYFYVHTMMYQTGLSGSVTRKIRATSTAGSGARFNSDLTYPRGSLVVEDMGPA